MNTKSTYTIKYVASKTGLKPYLIRSWEARYQAICPQRSDNNRRCFNDNDVKRLRLLKQAVDEGHSISTVAKMSSDELRRLLGRDIALVDSGDAVAAGTASNGLVDGAMAGQFVERALSHTIRLNPTGLEHVLSEAAVDMPRQSFLQMVVLPLFGRIGELWRLGKLKIINEHMATVVARTILWDMLRSVDLSEAAPRIVVATPVGHWHELGALASALAASESGWRVYYFGPNLPAEEIAYAAKKIRVKALALSLCHSFNDLRLSGELKKLRRLVGRHLPIFIGGSGSDPVRQIIQQINGISGIDLGGFRERLEALAEA
ncbi:MAG: MerR family transcriptional regulator [Desulfobacteraceae bacterium]|jgi:DNA-binding transcriptional MerR regulator/methylmalonyl-CoA mutase cobalamin-binding subunit